MAACKTQVLVVGGGLAGLTAAVLLAWRGVSCLLVERRPSTSRHPRARGVNLRSMELLSRVPGLAKDLVAASPPEGFSIIIAESVTGRVIRNELTPGEFDPATLSPSPMCLAAQDRVETILLRHARQLGADIRFGQELDEFEQDGEAVHAKIRSRDGTEEFEVHADYMIAADGNRSPIRQRLGIGSKGLGMLSHNIMILFRAKLDGIVKDRGFPLYYLQNPAFRGAFVTTDDPDVGQVSVEYDPARETPESFDAERAISIVRAALGTPELAVEVLDVMPWDMTAQCADSFRQGRIFLAGDAAHTMPPTGGLGGQTAMQDAADLAWKLAFVLGRAAGPGLLATYVEERRPVAALTVEMQTANYVDRVAPDRRDIPPSRSENDYPGVAFGYRYRSPAILPDVPDDGRATDNPFRLDGRPGSRLPHLWVERSGRKVSTLDMVGPGFVLLTGPGGMAWCNAVRRVRVQLRIDITACQMGLDFIDQGEFLQRTGLTAEGALLVRPDGFVCWRGREADPDAEATIAAVLNHALSNAAGFQEDAA